MRDKLKQWYEKIVRLYDSAIVLNATLFIILSTIIFGFSYQYFRNNPTEFFEQFLFASYGMILDIAVIGILITWITERREKKYRIQSYMNEIDDFRSWVSEESMFRTVGNIKRLNKNSITEMNLVDCTLRNINLNYANLTSSNLNSADISNSTLIGAKLNNCRMNQTNFENSNLNQAELINAFATGSNFKDSYLIKCDFRKAYLIKANFENAFLIEADLKDAIVSDAVFRNASLYKADLRGALGLKAEQLVNVKSLYLTKLDPSVENELKRLAPHLQNA